MAVRKKSLSFRGGFQVYALCPLLLDATLLDVAGLPNIVISISDTTSTAARCHGRIFYLAASASARERERGSDESEQRAARGRPTATHISEQKRSESTGLRVLVLVLLLLAGCTGVIVARGGAGMYTETYISTVPDRGP